MLSFYRTLGKVDMSHQINLFLLLFGAFQGALLSLWFLTNHKRKIANIYFAIFLFVVGFQLTLKVITKVWMMDNIILAYLISYKLPYLVGPLLYLYVSARKGNVFAKRDLFHFAPFFVFALVTILTFYIQRGNLFYVHPYVQAALQVISLVTYGYLSLRLGNLRLFSFIKLVIIAEIIIAITFAVMVVYYGRFPDVKLLFMALTILIYWISYKAISEPDLFMEKQHAGVIMLGLQKSRKYAHSSLKVDEALRIEQELNYLMQHEKLFKDADLTIDILSTKLHTSKHHLSQVLNEKLNKSYGDFISELRLNEAKKRLSEPANFRFTIASIALDSGFSSVSSFNEVFKKRFLTTPSKFREQQLKKMSA